MIKTHEATTMRWATYYLALSCMAPLMCTSALVIVCHLSIYESIYESVDGLRGETDPV